MVFNYTLARRSGRRQAEATKARAPAAGGTSTPLQALRSTAEALSLVGDERSIQQVMVRSAADALNAPWACLLGVHGDDVSVLAEFDEQLTELRGQETGLVRHPSVARVAATGKPWAGELRGRTWPPDSAPELGRLHSGAFAAVPCDGEVVAILAAADQRDRMFSRQDLELLQELGILCTLAITKTQRFTLEREHAGQMAALERAKSSFLNLASHELRGPLGVLNGYLSMFNEGAFGTLPAPAQQVLRLLSAKVVEMNALVNDMLEVSRLEHDRFELSVESFDLREVAVHTAEDWRPLAREGMTISVVTPEAPVLVDGDITRVRTIVTNLISNALKYSPAGRTVVCSVKTADGNAELVVEDDGVGIAAESLPVLFTRFGRIVTPETSHIPGTGLGLYVSRELARAHGGDVTVNSELGRGSVFTLTLPVRGQDISS